MRNASSTTRRSSSGAPHLEAVRHAHAIDLHEHVVRQVDLQVGVLRALHRAGRGAPAVGLGHRLVDGASSTDRDAPAGRACRAPRAASPGTGRSSRRPRDRARRSRAACPSAAPAASAATAASARRARPRRRAPGAPGSTAAPSPRARAARSGSRSRRTPRRRRRRSARRSPAAAMPRHVKGRNRRRVGERLVEAVDDAVDHRRRIGPHDFGVVLGLEARRGQLRRVELVVRRLAEADRRRDTPAPSASAMYDTTRPESMPPDRNAPSGTSLSRRSRTAVRMRLVDFVRQRAVGALVVVESLDVPVPARSRCRPSRRAASARAAACGRGGTSSPAPGSSRARGSPRAARDRAPRPTPGSGAAP